MCNEIYSTRSTTTQQSGELNYGTHFNGIIKYAVLIENTAKSIEIYPPGTQKCLSWLTLSVVCLSLDRSPIAAKYNVIELCKPSIRSFQDFSHSSSSSSLRFPYFSSSIAAISGHSRPPLSIYAKCSGCPIPATTHALTLHLMATVVGWSAHNVPRCSSAKAFADC